MRTSILFVVAIILLASNLLAAEVVELKDVSGKYTIKAAIKKVADGKVQVVDENGKTSEYPLEIFDRESLILILNAVAKSSGNQKSNGDSLPIMSGGDDKKIDLPPAPTSPEEVGKLWIKALLASESSEENGIKVLSVMDMAEKDLESIFMEESTGEPKITNEKSNRIRGYDQYFNLSNYTHLTYCVSKGISRDNASWTAVQLSRLQWSEIDVLAIVTNPNRAKFGRDVGETTSVYILMKNRGEYYSCYIDEVVRVSVLGNRWFTGDDRPSVRRIRMNEILPTRYSFAIGELKARNDNSLAQAIAILENNREVTLSPSRSTRSVEERLARIEPKHSESEILTALDIAEKHNVHSVNLESQIISNAIWLRLKEMSSVTLINLDDSKFGDSEIAHLVAMRGLENLSLDNTLITNEGLRNLVRLPNLKGLSISDTAISDAGVQHLKLLKNLGYITMRNTQITQNGVAELKLALPKCSIYVK
jgi:hypothetical protein